MVEKKFNDSENSCVTKMASTVTSRKGNVRRDSYLSSQKNRKVSHTAKFLAHQHMFKLQTFRVRIFQEEGQVEVRGESLCGVCKESGRGGVLEGQFSRSPFCTFLIERPSGD